MNSLMNAFSKTQETAQLRTLELQILSDFKEQIEWSSAKTLAERIFYLDVAFKKNPDAVELQKEMLTKLNEKFEKNTNSVNRNDVISLLINSFSKIHVPTAETSQAAIQLIV